MPRRSASASYVPRRLLIPAAAAAAVLAAAGVAATALRSPTELTVATFTLNKQANVLTRTILSEYATHYQFPSPDVVVCQDSPLISGHISLGPDYTCVYHGGVSNSSSGDMRNMSVFVHKSWKTTASRIYKTELCPTDRNTVIFTISRGGATFKIANVDLCGGGGDEQNINPRVSFPTPETIKTEMYYSIKNCDVILGNFNSDLNYFIAKQQGESIPNSTYQTTLQKNWISTYQIEVWKNSMFEKLLGDAKKRYAHEEDQAYITDLTQGIASSAIWFDPERLTQQAFHCLDKPSIPNMKHLGLVARFEIKK